MNEQPARNGPATADELLYEALDLPPEKRDAFLVETCRKLNDGQSLLIEVKSLLRAHESAGTFLDQPALLSGEVPRADATISDVMIDRRLGPYRIVRRIGRGGMGDVYLAQRDDDAFDRQVAIKVIRTYSRAADDVVNRFVQERRLLAALDHPNIARLIDGGTTQGPDAQPYLVMEYVQGEAIDKYCDSRRLSIDQRLDVFLTVCQAVQFAHRNLIIHRDLKPANILVAHDTVKLLDFGIAKMLAEDEPDPTDVTMTVERRHTPAYASPEQVRPRPGQPVTTSTDVYSLGVILYELLTGRKPYGAGLTSIKELEDAVCDKPPTRPSAAVRLGETDQYAATRGVDVARLQRQLRGDLETIILKALRKEPDRRYGSVEQLAEDIRRYRRSLPITARPDALWYRTSRFVARNRVGVAAMITFVLLLVAGMTITSFLYMRSEHALEIAAEERDRAVEAETVAAARFSQVRQLARTIMFDLHDQIERLAGATDARRLLIETSLEYLDALALEADDDLELMRELAAGYDRLGRVQGNSTAASLGDPAAGLASLLKAEAILHRVIELEPQSIETAERLFSIRLLIARMLTSLNRSDEAMRMFENLVPLAEQLRDSNPSSPRLQRNVMLSHNFLGNERLHIGDSAGAMESYLAARTVAEQMHESNVEHEEVLRDMQIMSSKLGDVYLSQHMLIEAAAAYSRHLPQLLDRAESNPADAQVLRDLALLYMNLGNTALAGDEIDRAIEQYHQSLDALLRLVELDPSDATVQRDLSILYEKLGDSESMREQLEESLAHYQASYDISVRLAHEMPSNINNQISLAWCGAKVAQQLSALGSHTQARALLQESIDIIEPIADGHAPFTFVQTVLATANDAMAKTLLAMDHAAEAQQYARQFLDIAQLRFELQPDDPPSRPMLVQALCVSAAVACDMADAEAAAMMQQAQAILDELRESRWGRNEQRMFEQLTTLREGCGAAVPPDAPTHDS